MNENDREELMDRIAQLNKNATRQFLQGFSRDELLRYLADLTNQDLEKVEICC